MKKHSYFMSEWVCPYCDSSKVRCSDINLFHTLRIFLGVRKRYCEECHKKWRIKSRYGIQLKRELLIVLLLVGASFGVLHLGMMIKGDLQNAGESMNQAVFGAAFKGQDIIQGISREMTAEGDYVSGSKRGASKITNAASQYAQKFDQTSLENKRAMFQEAQSYLQKYQTASNDEKQRLIAEAKARVRNNLY